MGYAWRATEYRSPADVGRSARNTPRGSDVRSRPRRRSRPVTPAWAAQQSALERDVKEVDAGPDRVVQGIVKAGASDRIVAPLKIEEQKRRDVRARLAQVQTTRSVTALDTDKIKREVFELVGDVTGVLRDRITAPTRMMLRRVLEGQIVAEPINIGGRGGYRLTGHVTFASFLRGDVFEALKAGAQLDGGGPNGIRTRVLSHDHVFASSVG